MKLSQENLEQLLRDSIWMHTGGENFTTDKGEYIASATDRTKIEYIYNVENWITIFNTIVKLIKDFTNHSEISESIFRNEIRTNLNKIEKVQMEVVKNTSGVSTVPGSQSVFFLRTLKIRHGQKLYRYSDDKKNHVYANPNFNTFGRFTDPDRGMSVFYLAFDKKVAKEEVKGTNSKYLIKYEVLNDFEVQIMPGTMSSFSQADKFFEGRIKKFHNLIFSLQSSDGRFIGISDMDRLNRAIYITTNALFDILTGQSVRAIVYPSTKVKENSELGKLFNNEYFMPNEKNADIAIFGDVQFEDEDRRIGEYSKFVRKIE